MFDRRRKGLGALAAQEETSEPVEAAPPAGEREAQPPAPAAGLVKTVQTNSGAKLVVALGLAAAAAMVMFSTKGASDRTAPRPDRGY